MEEKLIQFEDVKVGEFFKWDNNILLKFYNEEWDEMQSMVIQGDELHEAGDILLFDNLIEIDEILKNPRIIWEA